MKYSLKINKTDLLKVANDQHEQMTVLAYLAVFLFAYACLF